MKFMLMMHTPRGNGDYGVAAWSHPDLKAHIEFMKDFAKDLSAAGQLVAAEGLTQPGDARIVRSDKGKGPEVTDGPYPESKEFLAGYWIVKVASAEEAYAIAARASAAPGPGGKPMDLAIEVRQVGEAPPV